MKKIVFSFFFILAILKGYSQSCDVWVKAYNLNPSIKAAIFNILKSDTCLKYFNNGYLPVVTLTKDSNSEINLSDTLTEIDYPVKFQISFKRVSSSISATPAKIGVAFIGDYEVTLILYEFMGISPIPGQTTIKTYCMDEIFVLQSKTSELVLLENHIISTIVWNGQDIIIKNEGE